MDPYYRDDTVTLYHGDCREVLPGLPGGSVDLLLTRRAWRGGKR